MASHSISAKSTSLTRSWAHSKSWSRSAELTTKPGTVEQGSHQPWCPAKMGHHGLHLFSGQDDGEADRALGADDLVEPREVLLQDFSIEEEEGTQGLILGRGSYTSVKREG